MANTFQSLPPVSVAAQVDVELDANSSSVAVGDGTNELVVNPDGSINVQMGAGNLENEYNEITSVASLPAFSTVLSYIAPNYAKIKHISAAGTNIAEWEVLINGAVTAKQYTHFGSGLNCVFDFRDGINIGPGDMVVVQVRHARPSLANFNANLLVQI